MEPAYFTLSESLFSWKKTIFIIIFFLITPITLITSFISLSTLINSETEEKEPVVKTLSYFENTGAQVYASLPNSFPSISGEIMRADSRIGLLKIYLSKNDSPLYPYANYIIETSDKYSLDWRLTTAIAQKESGLCRAIPTGSNNCWGWGIHSQGSLGFDSLPEGIDRVSSGLKNFYIDEGYVTPEEIMTKYAHPSSTTWAEGVLQYMVEISNSD